MYSISWLKPSGESCNLVGEQSSILHMTHLLENKGIYFKVSNIETGRCSQKDLGCGDFRYWLNATVSFYDPHFDGIRDLAQSLVNEY